MLDFRVRGRARSRVRITDMTVKQRIFELVRRELKQRLFEPASEAPPEASLARRGAVNAAPEAPIVDRAFSAGIPDSPAESRHVALQVIFVQYDRKKYDGALERLISVLGRFEGLKCGILVVDNLRPGSWSHVVNERLTHLGGDNTAWEFSAFDRGLAYLDSIRVTADAYALVTDAFLAYGDAFLGLIEPSLLRVVARGAAVGWSDAWPEETTVFGRRYQDWLRTSFVLLRADVLSKLRPLAAPLDPAALFTGDPASPFQSSAPLGDGLRAYLLEWLASPQGGRQLTEGWHSQFHLDGSTLALFQQKTLAILREHLLTVRLRDESVPCYDFRLFRRLREGGLGADALDTAVLSRFEGTRWNSPDDGALRLMRSHLDVVEFPASIVHGDACDVHVVGWVLASPQPDVVHLKVGGRRALIGLCGTAREDVTTAFPGYGVERPGFSVRGALRDLAPGVHDVVLDVGAGHAVDVGKIEVLPLFSFVPRRIVVPDAWPAGRAVPFSIEGELRTSFRAESATVRIEGAEASAEVFLGEGILSDTGYFTHDVAVTGQASLVSPADQHAIELAVTLSVGSERKWVLPFSVARTEIPSTVRRFEVGPFDPDTALTDVALDVEVFDVRPGDRLIVERAGIEILERTISESSIFDFRGMGRATVSVERRVEGIPGGKSSFSLVLRRGRKRSVVWSGELLVRYRHPEVHLERLSASLVRADDPSTYRISATGWVKNHFLVDCLIVEIGGSRAAVFGLHELRPDVAEAFGSPLVLRQGFDATVEAKDVPAGEHVVHIIATQQGGERARVSRRVLFEEPPARRLSVSSDDLERLLRGRETNFYSAIALRGSVTTQMEDTVATLLVGDRLADEQPFDGTGRHEFSLRAAPKASGDYDVRFLVSSRGRVVFSTEPVRVAFHAVDFPESLSRDLGSLLDRFDLRTKIVGQGSDAELVRRLVERQPERVPDFTNMLSEIGEKVRRPMSVRRSFEPRAVTSRRRLKVLLASWEVPSRFHGGGVYLSNLLSRIGENHDVTLVHTCGVDEVGESDALKPYLKRIISVPRTFRSAQYRGGGRFPLHLYDCYIPELRRVLELEATSGHYDLADYEYSSMGPYIVPGIPSVLTVYETGYTALLNSAFAKARSADSTIEDLDRLVRSFHYYTVELPSLCDHLATLTEEDAAAITNYSDVRVYTNPGGVEMDDSAVPAPRERGAAPVLAYVGNFQHPPNSYAVKYFAEEVMPTLVARYPNAEFRVYGSKVPAEIRELGGKNGVRFMGFVEDIRAPLRDATAVVAPLFTGTGMRIKVLESLGAGALVIGTDLAMRGLAVQDRQHFHRANTAEEFVRAVVRAVEHPNEAAAIARAGQDLVTMMHSWDAVVKRREAIWFSTLEDAERGEVPESDVARVRAGG